MKNILFIVFLLFSIIINAQVIDCNNFSEERMNSVMFSEMNKYVKETHNGDSLIWSNAVQKDIMTDNYNFIKNNPSYGLQHNPKWIRDGKYAKTIPDTIIIKIIEETSLTFQNYMYSEILGAFTIINSQAAFTYEFVVQEIMRGWYQSPSHAANMNADYKNQVVVGVCSYFDKKRRIIYISFVHIG